MSHLWKNVDLDVKIMVQAHLEEYSLLVCLGLIYKLKNAYRKLILNLYINNGEIKSYLCPVPLTSLGNELNFDPRSLPKVLLLYPLRPE